MNLRVTTTSAIQSASGDRTEKTFDCVRRYEGNLPFIGTTEPSFAWGPKLTNGEWQGVQCSHCSEKKSPHLIGTHIESNRHVFGNAPSIHSILLANPRYLEKMEGLHLIVSPELQKIEEILFPAEPNQKVCFHGGETYTLPLTIQVGSWEKIITKQGLEKALGKQTPKPNSVLFLQFAGCDEDVANWPYLTNEAVQFLYEFHISILALNIPSMDREHDSGRGSNHKIFFQNQDNLIIESARLNQLPPGKVSVSISIDEASMDVDCASCDHIFVEPQRN